MNDSVVTRKDIELLAKRFESLRVEINDDDFATLQAVFELAGIGMSATQDVEGFSNQVGFAVSAPADRNRGMMDCFDLGLRLDVALPRGGVKMPKTYQLPPS